MKTLNLVYKDKSDIGYKVSQFPDGQQNITINKNSKFTTNVSIPVLNNSEDYCLNKSFALPIQIKSRLNNFKDLELIIAANSALRGLGVREIHLYTPYFLGSRSDRKFEEGSCNYLKRVICPIINSLNFETVTVLDPHSDVLEACIKSFKKVSNLELIKFAIHNDICLGPGFVDPDKFNNLILISPDAGASKKIYKLAEQIGYKGDVIICSKDRDKDGKLTKVVVPLKNFDNKDHIIIDDICDGGATFINIAKKIDELYKENPIKKDISSKTYYTPRKYLIVTHGIFSNGFSELSKYFDGVYCTNSYKDLHIDHFPELKCFKQLNVF